MSSTLLTVGQRHRVKAITLLFHIQTCLSSNSDQLISVVFPVSFRVSTLHFFTLDQEGEEKLALHSRLCLPHCPLDMTFDPEGRLWVLMDSSDAPLQMYTHRGDSWEVQCRTLIHVHMLIVLFQTQAETHKKIYSNDENLYIGYIYPKCIVSQICTITYNIMRLLDSYEEKKQSCVCTECTEPK